MFHISFFGIFYKIKMQQNRQLTRKRKIKKFFETLTKKRQLAFDRIRPMKFYPIRAEFFRQRRAEETSDEREQRRYKNKMSMDNRRSAMTAKDREVLLERKRQEARSATTSGRRGVSGRVDKLV